MIDPLLKTTGFENAIDGDRLQRWNKDLAFSKLILDLLFSKRYTADGF